MSERLIIQLADGLYLVETSPGCYAETKDRSEATVMHSRQSAEIMMLFLSDYPDAEIVPLHPARNGE